MFSCIICIPIYTSDTTAVETKLKVISLLNHDVPKCKKIF